MLDLVRENLHHAKALLGQELDNRVFLAHGDACALAFPDESFDAIWTVQALQHIPDLHRVLVQIHRVLKSGGIFMDYSLNLQHLLKCLYSLLGKRYCVEGAQGSFFLRRGSSKIAAEMGGVFSSPVAMRFSEILFLPELRMQFTGRPTSILGRLDARLSGSLPLLSLIARQRSFTLIKPMHVQPERPS